MTITLAAGCALVACGPILALFGVLVAPNDMLVILSIGSAFFWLITTSIASTVWFVSTLRAVGGRALALVLTVLLQELGRVAFYVLYTKADRVLQPDEQPQPPHPPPPSSLRQQQPQQPQQLQQPQQQQQQQQGPPPAPPQPLASRLMVSVAAGVGPGLLSVLVMYTTLLWDATGPGTLPSPACPQTDLFVVSSVHALCFSLLAVVHSVVAFDALRAWRTLRGKLQLGAVVLTHAAASAITLLNGDGGSCVASTLLQLALTAACCAYCAWLVRATYVVKLVNVR